LILCVCAIRKKDLKTKRKTLFDLRFFYLSRGKEKGKGETKRRKTEKKQYTHQANSNSPGESIARERPVCVRTRTGRERVLLFINRVALKIIIFKST